MIRILDEDLILELDDEAPPIDATSLSEADVASIAALLMALADDEPSDANAPRLQPRGIDGAKRVFQIKERERDGDDSTRS